MDVEIEGGGVFISCCDIFNFYFVVENGIFYIELIKFIFFIFYKMIS